MSYKVTVDISKLETVQDLVTKCHDMLGSALPSPNCQEDLLIKDPDYVISHLSQLTNDCKLLITSAVQFDTIQQRLNI